MQPIIDYKNLGLIDYKEAWDIQEDFFQRMVNQKLDKFAGEEKNKARSLLILCEHPHVYTLGKSGEQENLLISDELLKKINATYYRINRGGDITYHGPGQIVGYPIFDLELFGLQVKQYIVNLEESIIRTLAIYDIEASRLDGATGVWLDPDKPGKARKICAIGVKASRFVTMHGFAFNVNTNLDYFGYINPCGFVDKGVTSLEKELGRKMDMKEVRQNLKKKLAEVFGYEYGKNE